MKRPAPHGALSGNKRKRQKNGSMNAHRSPSSPARLLESATPLNLDRLKWKQVAIPGRLDDYEGFMGLEEIEDIEVSRESEGSKVLYRLSRRSNREDQLANGMSKCTPTTDDRLGLGALSAEGTPAAQDEEEWQGIDTEVNGDDVELMQPGHVLEPTPGEAEVVIRKPAHNVRTFQPHGDLAVDHLPFGVLEEEVLEEEVDTSAWIRLDLSSDTLMAIARLKFSTPTPIQSAAIPKILAGHDVIGKAPTGSGKTLAYGIPLLEHHLLHHQTRGAQGPIFPTRETSAFALILSPTRELAHQISTHLKALFCSTAAEGPLVAAVTGGLSVQKQRRLISKADIIIATPGRLWEVMSEDLGVTSILKNIDYLVVDEADRLLSEGNFQEVAEILNALDKTDENEGEQEVMLQKEHTSRRQTLLFSATFNRDLQQKLKGKVNFRSNLMSAQESMEYLLDKLNFREPKPHFIDMSPTSHMVEGLKERIVECGAAEKDLYLYALLLYHPTRRTLVFANSVSAVRRLTPYLQNLNIQAFALHSHMAQKARLRSVERFSAREGTVLVATDVAARGLDIPGVRLVIHYNLPRTADMYVHRSGRTARALRTGSSILLCNPEEAAGVRRLVAKVHARTQNPTDQRLLRSLDLDHRIIVRLKPRVVLAKKLADATVAKEKQSPRDDWLRAGAEDLGVEYDSEELETSVSGRRGRGNSRKKAERQARSLTKTDFRALRAELREMLSHRINVGISERYITGSGTNLNALLSGRSNNEFLGPLAGLALDD